MDGSGRLKLLTFILNSFSKIDCEAYFITLTMKDWMHREWILSNPQPSLIGSDVVCLCAGSILPLFFLFFYDLKQIQGKKTTKTKRKESFIFFVKSCLLSQDCFQKRKQLRSWCWWKRNRVSTILWGSQENYISKLNSVITIKCVSDRHDNEKWNGRQGEKNVADSQLLLYFLT